MLERIGSAELLLSQMLFVPENDVVSFEVPNVGSAGLPIKIIITSDTPSPVGEDDKSEPSFSVEYESDNIDPIPGANIKCVILKFHNFTKNFGQTLQVPQVIAVINDERQVTFLASVYKFGRITKLEVQFMMEKIK